MHAVYIIVYSWSWFINPYIYSDWNPYRKSPPSIFYIISKDECPLTPLFHVYSGHVQVSCFVIEKNCQTPRVKAHLQKYSLRNCSASRACMIARCTSTSWGLGSANSSSDEISKHPKSCNHAGGINHIYIYTNPNKQNINPLLYIYLWVMYSLRNICTTYILIVLHEYTCMSFLVNTDQ